MAGQHEGTSGRAGARYDRHDEAFWRDMLAQWGHSGGSIRAFCRQHGLAVSTFGLWRKCLNHEPQSPAAPPMALTADTAFIAAAANIENNTGGLKSGSLNMNGQESRAARR